MKKKIRLDFYLLEQGFANTRQKAQRLILAGKVQDINGRILDKPGQQIFSDSQLKISKGPKFVSRGGDKLSHAFKIFPLNVNERVCLDAGISTGGFTDCLLQNGAKKIYGIDVGYGQTSWSIRNNPKVKLYERTNIRYLRSESIFSKDCIFPNFVVADLSFISLKLVLNPITNLLSRDFFEGVFLIKPQFEVGKEFVNKGGVVRDPRCHILAIESFIEYAKSNHWKVNGLIASPLVGPAGNHEYLLWMSSNNLFEKSVDNKFIKTLVNSTLN
tara:strand:+ start:2336 stop:3151 length:816 start_codon:yes stop_codon:yes gene_type:complete